MTKGTTMVTNNVFRSTRLFGKGFSNMVLFSFQLMTLRSYMTNHQSHHNSGKLELLNGSFDLTAFSLHLFISFIWRNVHWFVLWGRTHNRHKIRYHNIIATNILILFRYRFSNQTLSMHFKRFIFTFKIINKFSFQVYIQTPLVFQENVQQVFYTFQLIFWIHWA